MAEAENKIQDGSEEASSSPAYDELIVLLNNAGYKVQRVVVIPDGLWNRIRAESRDPFGATDERKSVVFWHRGWTMVVPASRCLVLV